MDNNKLRAKWSKRDKDIMYYYPDKRDGGLLHVMFTTPLLKPLDDKNLLELLTERGYDITTFKFEIKKLPEKP